MRQRIELHIETSYSYKNKSSIITPAALLNKAKDEQIKVLGIVDYCTCSIIPKIELLKKEMGLTDLKVIYGINLNIRYDNLYVPSTILAKNEKGIKALYKIVTRLNEDDCYFILWKDLKEYLEDLILGISDFSLTEDYRQVIAYYEYVEVTPSMSSTDVKKINKFCQKHHLLLIAPSKPKRLEKHDPLINVIQNTNYNYHHAEQEYYHKTEELLEAFNYLDNKIDVVINNPYKLINNISNYNLDFSKKYMPHLNTKGNIRKEVLERANLIYIEDIPQDVMDRLNYELDLIEKYNLEGTIQIMMHIINKAQKLGSNATVGNFFSHSLVAYILGMIEINPMDLKKQINIFNDFEKYGFQFEICLPENIRKEILDFLKRLLDTPTIYHKSNLVGCQHRANDHLKDTLREIKTHEGVSPHTYYLVSKDINILDITPVNYLDDIPILDFSNDLKRNFVSLHFKSTFVNDRLSKLEEKTKVYREYISFDDQLVFKNMYEIIENNTEENYIDWNIANNYVPKLKISLSGNEKEPHDIYELIELDNETNPHWLTKVVQYYYDSYYMLYHEEEYYEIYLKELINIFAKQDIINGDFIKDFIHNYKNNTVEEQIQKEENSILRLIMQTMFIILEKNLENIIWKVKKHYE